MAQQYHRCMLSRCAARPTCFHDSSNTLPQKLSPQLSLVCFFFFLRTANISSVKAGCHLKSYMVFFLKIGKNIRPASIKLKLWILLSLLTTKLHCKDNSRMCRCFSVFSFLSTKIGVIHILSTIVLTCKNKHKEHI